MFCLAFAVGLLMAPPDTIMPVYPGGIPEMEQVLSERIDYPKEKCENGETGNARITVYVDERGRVDSAILVGGSQRAFSQAALQACKSLPPMKPAIVGRERVPYQFDVRIRFYPGTGDGEVVFDENLYVVYSSIRPHFADRDLVLWKKFNTAFPATKAFSFSMEIRTDGSTGTFKMLTRVDSETAKRIEAFVRSQKMVAGITCGKAETLNLIYRFDPGVRPSGE